MRRSIAVVAVLVPTTLQAQGWIEPPRDAHGFGVVRESTVVSVHVSGRVARVDVEEWFRNDGAAVAEGDYLYPLPGGAVFTGYSLFQGDRELRGETMDADEARRIYEEVVRRRRDPALIERIGDGLIRARVFPIERGQRRRIMLRYTQVLERAGDAFEFRYVAGGPNPGGARPDDLRGVGARPRPAPPGAGRITFELVVDSAEAFRDPFSPTHALRVERREGRLVVRPASPLDGTLALYLPLARGPVGVTLAAHRASPGEDGYFMLTLSPGAPEPAAVLPRDVTVVLDVSGSMSGEKIEQARAALHQLLATLGDADRFRLIAFSSRVEPYAADWRPATRDELAAARRWVDGLHAEGGTDIDGALQEAFRLPSPGGRLPIVVFLTDGLPSVGERDPERIAERAERERGRARVFAFGVGYDVNTVLLDRLGAAGRGATEYVEPGEDVEIALGTLAAKIRHPVLTDLEIADAPVRLREIYPATLPDLFAGEELVIFGRYQVQDRDRSGDLVLVGRRAGRQERFAARVTFPAEARAHRYLPRLWASRKIGELTRRIRLEGPDPELVDAVRRTALRYGLLSEYTAHLVVEPEAVVVRDGGRPRAAHAPPAVATAAVGRGAVVAAEKAREQRAVASVAALGALEARAAAEARARDGAAGVRLVAGRRFVLRDGVWTDLAHAADRRIIEVAPFGQAYFELLVRLPELGAYLREFRQVLVAGAAASIRIADGGADTLPAAELDRIVTDFRGD
ncbi:MAG TPA: VIT domain-containing protein [Longimicrobiales bacterium]